MPPLAGSNQNFPLPARLMGARRTRCFNAAASVASRFPPITPLPAILMATDTEPRVKSIIVEKLGVDESEIARESSFTNDLGADSLDTVELIMEFEKEFNMTIPDEDAEKIATVGDAVDYVDANRSA